MESELAVTAPGRQEHGAPDAPEAPEAGSNVSSPRSPASLDHIAQWRAELLHRIIFYTLMLDGVAMAIAAAQTGGKDPGLLLGPALMFVGLSAAVLLRRSGKILSALAFTGAMFSGIALMVFQNGLAVPNAYGAALVLIVVIALCIGWRFAWISLAAFCCFLVAIGWYFSVVGAPVPHPRQDSGVLGNWIRTAGILTTVGAVAVSSAFFLIRKLERALRHNEQLMQALGAENEQKFQALETQHQLRDQLRQAHQLEALGHLAAGVAHDFNNLLVVIMNNTAFAQEDWSKLTGKQNEELAEVEEAGERAADLVRQLLTFSGGYVSQQSRFEFSVAVRNSLRLLQRLLPSNIEVVQHTSQPVGCVQGVPVELDQIVFNLCVNARDAMPDGGTLEVSVVNEERTGPTESCPRMYACLAVADTGLGMAAGTKQRLFDPFFTTKPPGKGTGLGLSVVYGAIQQHGGFIEVDSELGAGSTFRVYLPIVGLDSAADAPQVVPRGPVKEGGTVLVVDDDEGVRRVLESLLTAAGYQVLLCCDGEEALALFKRKRSRIDLLLTDAVMPHLGGRQLYEEVHALDPQLPVLFCSGYTSGTLSADFFEHPGRALVNKPFAAGDVLSAVRNLLSISIFGL
jgi:signal transduction histidine kinase/CheY-like chemotaxis protein